MRTHPQLNRPILRTHGFMIEGNHDVPACIARLSCRSSPGSVLGGISFVILQPLKCMLRSRTQPHVLQESGKRLFPTLTDGNATSAIAHIALIIGIGTASLHRSPYTIFRERTLSVLDACTARGRLSLHIGVLQF